MPLEKHVRIAQAEKLPEPTKPLTIFDQWRPVEEVKYDLDETNIKMDAIVPCLNLSYTTVNYGRGKVEGSEISTEIPNGPKMLGPKMLGPKRRSKKTLKNRKL